MRRVWAIVVLLALMSVTAPPASAEADILANGELEVTHSPDSLWMRPGEMDTFEMTVKNAGDRRLNVSLEYMQIECPGGTSGEFSKSFLTLAPGAKETLTVDVTSYANFINRWCLDETNIRLEWGPNLTLDQDSHVERASVEDSDTVTFELHYEPTYGVLAAVITVVIVVALILIRRSRVREDRTPPTT